MEFAGARHVVTAGVAVVMLKVGASRYGSREEVSASGAQA